MCPVERLIASAGVCLSCCACDYLLCTPSIPPCLPSPNPPALSCFLSLSVCLCHGGSGTLRAQRSGRSTWWSRWLVVRSGLTWPGGARARGCQPLLQPALSVQPIFMFMSTPFNPRSAITHTGSATQLNLFSFFFFNTNNYTSLKPNSNFYV